ncbi:MAG: tetratricopeptide repeat protein [Polyangiaceae bacterium]
MRTSSTLVTKTRLSVVLCALALAPTRSVLAQSNEAIAESLFHEGKKLYTEERYAEACHKLDQSHRADPAGGTVLLLAMCYERLGKTASAWAKYNEAVALARRDNRSDREQKARSALSALEPQLSYVSVSLSPEAKELTNLEFVLDGAAIPPLLDSKVPVDPGDHSLVVRAKNAEPWSQSFSITEKGATLVISVPALKPLAETPSPQQAAAKEPEKPKDQTNVTEPPQLERRSNSSRTIAFVIGGVGIAAAGVGGYFAWRAKHLDDKANDVCPASGCSDRNAVNDSQDAVTSGNVATWLIGAGAAAMATASAILVFGGSDGSPRVSTSALVLPNGGALTVSGQY